MAADRTETKQIKNVRMPAYVFIYMHLRENVHTYTSVYTYARMHTHTYVYSRLDDISISICQMSLSKRVKLMCVYIYVRLCRWVSECQLSRGAAAETPFIDQCLLQGE
eukprot:GHVU01194253.1.p1 GENE.GHVU01194253.1~~GHVU01194253.1.p1  ORF type:complete len:108 (-),score=2.18 GHVU01194253.1:64-387(-)